MVNINTSDEYENVIYEARDALRGCNYGGHIPLNYSEALEALAEEVEANRLLSMALERERQSKLIAS
jgi:hypothetical protein